MVVTCSKAKAACSESHCFPSLSGRPKKATTACETQAELKVKVQSVVSAKLTIWVEMAANPRKRSMDEDVQN